MRGSREPDGSGAAIAVQHAAGQITRTGITFVVACTYFAIVAAATSHADLLIGRTLAIPLLDAEVPALAFFAVAPPIVILLHLNLLIVQRLYRRSLRVPPIRKSLESKPLRLTAFGASLAPRAVSSGEETERFVQILLFAVFTVVNVFLPLGVLLLLQLQFLPRHSDTMILWHRVALLADATAIVYFLPLILSDWGWWRWTKLVFQPRKDISGGKSKDHILFRLFRRFAARFIIFFIPLVAVISSTLIIQPPSEVLCSQKFVKPPWFPTSESSPWPEWFSYHLDVSRGSLSIPPGLRLVGRDLRCADLQGLDLHGVNFRRTEISGARFDDSNLSMTRFDQAKTGGIENERLRPSFRATDLRGASFRSAHLAGGDFHEADASGATFKDADLRRADLSKAMLLGSELDGAHLEGATLNGAWLTCSTATGVRLDLASLQEAHLEAVQFKGDSSAVGADLRGATLWEAFGLRLDHQNVEGAALGGFCPGPWLQNPTSISIRPSPVLHQSSLLGASFRIYTDREWRSNVTDRIERMVEGLGRNDRIGDIRVERVISRLPEICRSAALQNTDDSLVTSQWDDPAKSGRCLPPPPDNLRLHLVLGQEQANELSERFHWKVSASPPGAAATLENEWVRRRFVQCGDPDWMRVLLTRVFMERYMGLEELDRRLWEHISSRPRGDCTALDTAIEEICGDDKTGWHRAIDRFPGAAYSERRCPS